MGLNLACRVCGDRRGVVYRPAKRQMLCDVCDRKLSNKVSRLEFETYLWGDMRSKVPQLLRDEYYSAYLSSPFGLQTFQEMANDGRPTEAAEGAGDSAVRPGDGSGTPEGK